MFPGASSEPARPHAPCPGGPSMEAPPVAGPSPQPQRSPSPAPRNRRVWVAGPAGSVPRPGADFVELTQVPWACGCSKQTPLKGHLFRLQLCGQRKLQSFFRAVNAKRERGGAQLSSIPPVSQAPLHKALPCQVKLLFSA
ncbi:ejaculatory bulb-specific protein 1-like [Hylobates moloch]|uniref:ejaculatory bulb-specific protein 1-like n=1 Tax=Hylobates moloch TaxID=81572 RepID=UPI002674625C|nr:ejaculatory bulb-specific protein 1-like [Hylobates moloch]